MSDTLNWNELLRNHAMFRDLAAHEIEALLRPDVSGERAYSANEVILREGDVGDSVYLIGDGEVSVVITRHDNTKLTFASLGKGELFGEMAFFDDKPRSATIIAKDHCVVLEFKAQGFRDFLLAHPGLEFRIASMLSQRFRRVTEGVLQLQLRELDDRFTLLNSKIEAELKIFDNAVKTTQTLFDATNNRVKELSDRAASVVEIGNKNQEKLARAFKWVLGAGTPVAAIAAFLGVDSFLDILEKARTVTEKSDLVVEKAAQAEALINQLTIQMKYLEPKYFKYVVLDDIFIYELEDPNASAASDTFYQIISLGDENITRALLGRVMSEVISHKGRRGLLKPVLDRNIPRMPYKYRFLAYYLLLSAYDLDEEYSKFDALRALLKADLDSYTGDSIREGFSESFGPEHFEDAFYPIYYMSLYRRELLAVSKTNSKIPAEGRRVIDDESHRLARERTKRIKEIWNSLPYAD